MARGAPIEDVGRRTLEILSETTGDPEVLADLDLPLYDSGVLDSLGTVTLVVAFEEAFGLAISPAELDREKWSTPRSLVADIQRRLAGEHEA
jgi:D-alanine--poly(phosphoribitol) ligase subunit 2